MLLQFDEMNFPRGGLKDKQNYVGLNAGFVAHTFPDLFPVIFALCALCAKHRREVPVVKKTAFEKEVERITID
ncbi:hypothetical protein [Chitinophaga sp.]|uniref:hypothetical protein n=1 Tax=Chitinophaga sp. TaxID=1869181 RepID=UPI0031D68B0A